MLCSDTSGKLPAIRVDMPADLAADISKWLSTIKHMHSKGRITLFVSSDGDVVDSEVTFKPPRKRKSA